MAKGKRGKRRESHRDDEQDRRGIAEARKQKALVVTGKSLGQKRYINDIKTHDITICTGPAGTGKTVVAVGLALQGIMSETPQYDKLVILRPVKEACGEHLGFLPGDLHEKMMPWAAPVIDNMEVFVDANTVKNLFYHKKVEIIPLALARGRSLNKAFVIVDEAQNCSVDQMLMILTRLGTGSKMVINGDISQTDSKYEVNGLKDAMERLSDMSCVAICQMGCTEADIIRNPIIAQIIMRYSNPQDQQAPAQDGPTMYMPPDDDVEPVRASLENMSNPSRMK